jgi:hypothetical protein
MNSLNKTPCIFGNCGNTSYCVCGFCDKCHIPCSSGNSGCGISICPAAVKSHVCSCCESPCCRLCWINLDTSISTVCSVCRNVFLCEVCIQSGIGSMFFVKATHATKKCSVTVCHDCAVNQFSCAVCGATFKKCEKCGLTHCNNCCKICCN